MPPGVVDGELGGGRQVAAELAMIEPERVWSLIEAVAQEEGVTLFEIERPSGARGALRVFIAPGKEHSGIGHAQCSAVANRILEHPLVEEILPAEMTLEVSSPGVNRKLTRHEHFAGAVGERLKLTVLSDEHEGRRKRSALRGTLLSVTDDALEVRDEATNSTRTVPLSSVADARVDFQF